MDQEIAQFASITGAVPEIARYAFKEKKILIHSAYVESAGGDVQQAMTAYYEGDGAEHVASEAPVNEPPAPVAPAPASVPTPVESAPSRTSQSNVHTLSGTRASTSDAWPSSRRSGLSRSGGIMTFNDLRAGNNDNDEHDGRADDPLNFYTGGHGSGLNVENPEHLRHRSNQPLVNEILNKAASSSHQAPPPSRESHKPPASTAFSGRGFSLGGGQVGGEEPHRPNSSSFFGTFFGNTSAPEPEHGENDDEPVVRHLTFWQDGFSIEDGPLMRYDDPTNQETLRAINAGRAPLSVLNVRFGQPVELVVARRTNEKYVPPPPPPMKPFEGQGNRLGAPSAGIAAAPEPAAAPLTPSPASATADMPHVDESLPQTQIQVRLRDGQHLVVKLNHSHTVADLRRHINTCVLRDTTNSPPDSALNSQTNRTRCARPFHPSQSQMKLRLSLTLAS